MGEENFSSPLGFRGGLPLPENTRTGIAPSSARHVGTLVRLTRRLPVFNNYKSTRAFSVQYQEQGA